MENDFLKSLKPLLKLKVGDVVFLASDLKYKTPMTVGAVFYDYEDADIRCEWLNSQKKVEKELFFADQVIKI
jgi:hypothetical protein